MDLRVVATAGHVDHGKSSLILRLTGMDPDRFEEEKRRGLTIDLGFAWLTLPSGREIGFVDVPGHERFIANMLAGVGPVRLVLFVVAADEGWKPQSEEHLQILDVLGVEGGVIAVTKVDLVDGETRELALMETRERLQGSTLEGSPIVPVSSVSGEGLEKLIIEIDSMIQSARSPDPSRARLFVDRAFSIKGAGSVVTGTLTGGCVAVGDQVEILPTGEVARIRGLQTHKRSEERACPISRVAANLVGVERQHLDRGEVIANPREWKATDLFEAEIRPIRDLDRAITARGAFKVYVGAKEVDARIRFVDTDRIQPGGGPALVRIRTSEPLVLDLFDRFVVRDAGRRRTVAGGRVLDVGPPARAGAGAAERLRARAGARTRDEVLGLLVSERGFVSRDEAFLLTGTRERPSADPADQNGWLIDPTLLGASITSLERALSASPTGELERSSARSAIERSLREERRDLFRKAGIGTSRSMSVADVVIEEAVRSGIATMTPDGRIRGSRARPIDPGSFEGLLSAIGGEHETSPPTIKELVAKGFPRELLAAAERAGAVVRIAPDIVVVPSLAARAEQIVRGAGSEGITAGDFRERLGTTRRYAIPVLEWLDRRGTTRRQGDRRFARGN